MPDDTFRWVIAIAVAIATLSMFAMAVVSVVMYRVMTKVQAKVERLTDKAEPVVDSVRQLITVNAPKIGGIVANVEETAVNARDISLVAKDQAYRFAEVGRDISDRARAQVARVDAVVDETVEQVHNLGDNVKSAVMKPVNEFSGVLAGVRAAVSAYAQGRRPDIGRVTQDEEMFI